MVAQIVEHGDIITLERPITQNEKLFAGHVDDDGLIHCAINAVSNPMTLMEARQCAELLDKLIDKSLAASNEAMRAYNG